MVLKNFQSQSRQKSQWNRVLWTWLCTKPVENNFAVLLTLFWKFFSYNFSALTYFLVIWFRTVFAVSTPFTFWLFVDRFRLFFYVFCIKEQYNKLMIRPNTAYLRSFQGVFTRHKKKKVHRNRSTKNSRHVNGI